MVVRYSSEASWHCAQRGTKLNVDDEPEDSSYTRQVGLRLRAVRRTKRLSLHDVEMDSNKEFKASVLGAYERGERAISVPRLQRLASFYTVPVDQLLPPIPATRQDGDANGHEQRGSIRGITIDLVRLESMTTHEAALLGRYVTMIKAQRHSFTGTELTLRREDLNALSVILDSDVETVKSRLGLLGFELVN